MMLLVDIHEFNIWYNQLIKSTVKAQNSPVGRIQCWQLTFMQTNFMFTFVCVIDCGARDIGTNTVHVCGNQNRIFF